jgi:two-component system phosphate regulon sensor histidine kinase PhoR
MTRMERAQRDFVANVSHEFRTPLATISGCAETLMEGAWEDAENRRKFLEIIQANSVRLTNIAADLITLSQLDTAHPRLDPAPIPVEEVVSGALRAIRPVAGMHKVEVRAGEVCAAVVLGYRLAFEQALLNLLDNAVKFNRPSGEVIVRAMEAGDHVEISVADTGIGIPNEDLSRIFERFYRVDKARSRQIGGTGLGLSIVRQAVDQMHGTVRVESKPGKGSCFTITLPRHASSISS